MSAKEHDHDHDHDGHHHHHDEQPPAPLPATPEHGYWKSMRELAGKADWQQSPSAKEFPPGADQPPALDPMSRRNFFHLMGASAGLAGLAVGAGACRYEQGRDRPARAPSRGSDPGHDAAVRDDLRPRRRRAPDGRDALRGPSDPPRRQPRAPVEQRRHRRPARSATPACRTSRRRAILHLYDPDRSQSPLQQAAAAGRVARRVQGRARRHPQADRSAAAFASSSEAIVVADGRRRCARALAGKVGWHEYEPISWDNERAGTKLAFGRAVRPIAQARQVRDDRHDRLRPVRRAPGRGSLQPRLRAQPPQGRLARPGQDEPAVVGRERVLEHRRDRRSPPAAAQRATACRSRWRSTPRSPAAALRTAEFLKENKVAEVPRACSSTSSSRTRARRSSIAGRRQPPEVHAIVAKINQALGAVGATLDYVEHPGRGSPDAPRVDRALVKDMRRGQGQGARDPRRQPGLRRAGGPRLRRRARARCGTSIHLSQYDDETSQKCTWHVPQAHFLEAWGDARTWDGTQSLAQPLIEPLWGGLSNAELLSLLLGEEKTSMELVQAALGNPGNWKQLVHDGFVPNTALRGRAGHARRAAAGQPDAEPEWPARCARRTSSRSSFHYSSVHATTAASRTTRGCGRPRTS